MKKIVSIFIITLLTLVLTSCKESKFNFSSEMLMNNEIVIPKTRFSTLHSFDSSEYTIEEEPNLRYGLIKFSDKDGKLGCFSLYVGDFIVKPEAGIEINIIEKQGMSYVQKKIINDKKSILVDAFGNLVLEARDYINITPQIIYNIDLLGHITGTDYIEKISFSYVNEDSIFVTSSINYKLDIVNKTRTKIEYFEEGKYYTKKDRIDLASYGLTGYYMVNLNSTYHIYKDNGKLVNKIYLPDAVKLFAVNGNFIYQTKKIVDKKDNEYTYLENESKVKLQSYSVNILNGKVNELDLDYEINSVTLYKNKSNKPVYGFSSINKIIGKKKYITKTNVLIDKTGTILYEAGDINLLNIQTIDSRRFYDPLTRYVFNERLEPLFEVEGFRGIIRTKDNTMLGNRAGWMIVKQDGYYGIIDSFGTVIVPFEYENIYNTAIEETTIGEHKDGIFYQIGENLNYSMFLKGEGTYVVPGLVYQYYNNGDHTSDEKVIGEFELYGELGTYSFEHVNPVLPEFYEASNAFGKFTTTKLQLSSGKYIYILIAQEEYNELE